MAIIPKYEQQVGVSAKGVPTNVGVTDTTNAGLTEKAIGKVGAAIGQTAEVLELVRQRQEQQKQQDKINSAAQIEADFTRDFANWEISATSKKGNDAFNLVDEAQKFETEWIKQKGIKDPDVYEAASRKVTNHTSSRLMPISAYVKGQRDVVEKQTEEDLLSSKTELVFRDFSPATMKESLGSIYDFYDAKVKISTLDPLTAKIKMQEGTAKITKASIEGQLASNDVNVVRKVAEDLKTGVYNSLLEEKDREKYHKEGASLVKAMDKDIADNAKLALAELKEAKKADLDATEFEWNNKLYPKGGGRPQVTVTDVKKKEKLFSDTGSTVLYGIWLRRVEEAKEHFLKEGNGEYKTNKNVYAKIATDLSSDEPEYDVKKINARRNNGLSNTDADKLVDRFNNMKSSPTKRRQVAIILNQMKKDRDLMYGGVKVAPDFIDEEYSQEVMDFTNAITDPQTDPKEYFDTIIKPSREAKISVAIAASTKPGFFDNFFKKKAKKTETAPSTEALPKGMNVVGKTPSGKTVYENAEGKRFIE